MPRDKFQTIRTETDLIRFFESTFPDAVPLIGLDLLVGEYFKNPKGSLVSIKVSIGFISMTVRSSAGVTSISSSARHTITKIVV